MAVAFAEGVVGQPVLRGTCTAMCPEAEIKLREKERLLHPFEILAGQDRIPKADRNKVVKEFVRSAAGKEQLRAEDIRSPPVLIKTVDYLLESVATRTDVSWIEVYGFVSNRLRAVRQDLVVQDVHDGHAVLILEKAVRFYLYAGYSLCEADYGTFDSHINDTHLQECLKQLLRLYDLLDNAQTHSRLLPAGGGRLETADTAQCLQHRSEFESYYVLFNLGDSSALQHFLLLPVELRSTELLSIAWKLNRCYMDGNVVRLFRLAREKLTALQCCAFHHHVPRLWKNFLRTYCTALSSKLSRYPIGNLCRALCADREECMIFIVTSHGCLVIDKQISFQKANWKESAKVPVIRLSLFDEKINASPLGALLAGT